MFSLSTTSDWPVAPGGDRDRDATPAAVPLARAGRRPRPPSCRRSLEVDRLRRSAQPAAARRERTLVRAVGSASTRRSSRTSTLGYQPRSGFRAPRARSRASMHRRHVQSERRPERRRTIVETAVEDRHRNALHAFGRPARARAGGRARRTGCSCRAGRGSARRACMSSSTRSTSREPAGSSICPATGRTSSVRRAEDPFSGWPHVVIEAAQAVDSRSSSAIRPAGCTCSRCRSSNRCSTGSS